MTYISQKEPYANYDEIGSVWKSPGDEDYHRIKHLVEIVSDLLRIEAKKVGKNLDKMIAEDPALKTAAKSVVIDIVARVLMTSTDQEPMTQFSQAAGGYSVSGTYLVPGGGIYIKKSELARLGLRRQRVGVIDFYG